MPELDAVLTELGAARRVPADSGSRAGRAAAARQAALLAPAGRGRARRARRRDRRGARGSGRAHGDPRLARAPWRDIVRVEQLPPAAAPSATSISAGRSPSPRRAAGRRWLLVPDDCARQRLHQHRGPRRQGQPPLGNADGACACSSRSSAAAHAYIEKLIEPDAKVEPVDVGSSRSLARGAARPRVPRSRRRRSARTQPGSSGKTLLWQQGDVTLRLEGELSKDEALRIARSARVTISASSAFA